MKIPFTTQLPMPDEISHPQWERAEPILVTSYWSGDEAPLGRHFEVRSLWGDAGFAVRFIANQNEPLVVNPNPDLSKKTMELWDRDVCEIFIAPDPSQSRRYFEFEVAPTGEWIDLSVNQHHDGRETDWEYRSGMISFGKVEAERVIMSANIPWSAFGAVPSAGSVWRGNLMRCVGEGDSRGYLSWRPTRTPSPNFHVPEAFGEFCFVT